MIHIISVKEEYLNAKKNYDLIYEKTIAAISQELQVQKLDTNDPENDEKIVAIEMALENKMGMTDARHRLNYAEEKLLSWGKEKAKELYIKGIVREDFSHVFTTKVLRLRNDAIELALKLSDI